MNDGLRNPGGRPKRQGRGLPRHVCWVKSKTEWIIHIRHPQIKETKCVIGNKSPSNPSPSRPDNKQSFVSFGSKSPQEAANEILALIPDARADADYIGSNVNPGFQTDLFVLESAAHGVLKDPRKDAGENAELVKTLVDAINQNISWANSIRNRAAESQSAKDKSQQLQRKLSEIMVSFIPDIPANNKKDAVIQALKYLRRKFPKIRWEIIPLKITPRLRKRRDNAGTSPVFADKRKASQSSIAMLGKPVERLTRKAYHELGKLLKTDRDGVRFIALILLIDQLCKKLSRDNERYVRSTIERNQADGEPFRAYRKFISSQPHFKKMLGEQLSTLNLVSGNHQIENSLKRLFFHEKYDEDYVAQRNNYLRHLLNYESVEEALWNSARMGALRPERAEEVLRVKPQAVAYLGKLKRTSEKLGNIFIANTHIKLGVPPLFLEEAYGNEGAFVLRTQPPKLPAARSNSKGGGTGPK